MSSILSWAITSLVIQEVSSKMIITYQDKFQVVPATSIYSKQQVWVVNRVDRPDDGYAQDNGYFYLQGKSLYDVLWLVDCFFERVVEGTDNYYQSLANAADLESEFEEEKVAPQATTYTIPARFLSLIFNGDKSGLDDEDLELFEQFIEREELLESQGHWSYDVEENKHYFSKMNDITRWLGDEVVDIQWIKRY